MMGAGVVPGWMPSDEGNKAAKETKEIKETKKQKKTTRVLDNNCDICCYLSSNFILRTSLCDPLSAPLAPFSLHTIRLPV
jgi:hypothetical protein